MPKTWSSSGLAEDPGVIEGQAEAVLKIDEQAGVAGLILWILEIRPYACGPSRSPCSV